MFLLLLLTSCKPELPREENITKEETKNRVYDFNSDELAWIEDIRDSGGLKVASLSDTKGWDDPEITGFKAFHFNLVKSFAAWMNLPVEIESVSLELAIGDGSAVFNQKKNGILTASEPAVFETHHILANSLSLLPWRLQLMDIVPIIPNRVFFIGRNDCEWHHIQDVKDTTLALARNTSYEDIFFALQDSGILKSVTPDFYPLETDLLDVIQSGGADLTFMDSFESIGRLKNYPGLQVINPVSESEYLGWGISRDDSVLYGLIQAFLRQISRNGTLSEIYRKYPGISLEDYYSLIGFNPGEELFNLSLTVEERRELNLLRESGALNVAVLEMPESYNPQPDGTISGFDYNLALACSHILGIPLEVNVVKSLDDLFSINGVFSDDVVKNESIRYIPDLLRQEDVYIGAYTITPWRERLTRMIPMMPVGIVLAGVDGDKIREWDDLNGKRVILQHGSYQESMFREWEEQYNLDLTYVFYDNTVSPFELISEGVADVTLDGGVYIFTGMEHFNKISVSPLEILTVTIGWMVNPERPHLASLIKKLIDFSHSNGLFSSLYEENMGIKFETYLEMIGGP